jgi:hypothetical protein
MNIDLQSTARRVAQVLRESLERGAPVEIEGLGTFLPGKKQGFRFVAQTKPRIFIAYVEEDLALARKLYHQFLDDGFDPWLDKAKLLPGQNWPRAIETAIQTADFFVACFSRRSVLKRGTFQSELRYALECAARVPLDEIFFLPLRLEACTVPQRITRHIQYLDLFPEWEEGVRRVSAAIHHQMEKRSQRQLPLVG